MTPRRQRLPVGDSLPRSPRGAQGGETPVLTGTRSGRGTVWGGGTSFGAGDVRHIRRRIVVHVRPNSPAMFIIAAAFVSAAWAACYGFCVLLNMFA